MIMILLYYILYCVVQYEPYDSIIHEYIIEKINWHEKETQTTTTTAKQIMWPTPLT